MPFYYTPVDSDPWDIRESYLPDKEHLFDSDAEARTALLRWGAEDAYRIEGETRIYIIKDRKGIKPTSYYTVRHEANHPEI